jgi:sec-independent protein translocase protein TatA
MFRSIGPTELIIVLAIVLIIFGVGKLPSIGGAMGKAVKGFRKEVEGGVSKTSAKRTSAKKASAEKAPAKEEEA